MKERNIGILPDGQFFSRLPPGDIPRTVIPVFEDLERGLHDTLVHLHFPCYGRPEQYVIFAEAERRGWESIGYTLLDPFPHEDFLKRLDTLATIDPEARIHKHFLLSYHVAEDAYRQEMHDTIFPKLIEYLLPKEWRPLKDLSPEEIEALRV
ncbi:MAG: hypothetical protein HY520_05075 [Candidatus Aenigmarchaeota archaeon]|nr:hypothetical protein [Candidatus Aenigmarchaeota archaeon]